MQPVNLLTHPSRIGMISGPQNGIDSDYIKMAYNSIAEPPKTINYESRDKNYNIPLTDKLYKTQLPFKLPLPEDLAFTSLQVLSPDNEKRKTNKKKFRQNRTGSITPRAPLLPNPENNKKAINERKIIKKRNSVQPRYLSVKKDTINKISALVSPRGSIPRYPSELRPTSTMQTPRRIFKPPKAKIAKAVKKNGNNQLIQPKKNKKNHHKKIKDPSNAALIIQAAYRRHKKKSKRPKSPTNAIPYYQSINNNNENYQPKKSHKLSKDLYKHKESDTSLNKHILKADSYKFIQYPNADTNKTPTAYNNPLIHKQSTKGFLYINKNTPPKDKSINEQNSNQSGDKKEETQQRMQEESSADVLLRHMLSQTEAQKEKDSNSSIQKEEKKQKDEAIPVVIPCVDKPIMKTLPFTNFNGKKPLLPKEKAPFTGKEYSKGLTFGPINVINSKEETEAPRIVTKPDELYVPEKSNPIVSSESSFVDPEDTAEFERFLKFGVTNTPKHESTKKKGKPKLSQFNNSRKEADAELISETSIAPAEPSNAPVISGKEEAITYYYNYSGRTLMTSIVIKDRVQLCINQYGINVEMKITSFGEAVQNIKFVFEVPNVQISNNLANNAKLIYLLIALKDFNKTIENVRNLIRSAYKLSYVSSTKLTLPELKQFSQYMASNPLKFNDYDRKAKAFISGIICVSSNLDTKLTESYVESLSQLSAKLMKGIGEPTSDDSLPLKYFTDITVNQIRNTNILCFDDLIKIIIKNSFSIISSSLVIKKCSLGSSVTFNFDDNEGLAFNHQISEKDLPMDNQGEKENDEILSKVNISKIYGPNKGAESENLNELDMDGSNDSINIEGLFNDITISKNKNTEPKEKKEMATFSNIEYKHSGIEVIDQGVIKIKIDGVLSNEKQYYAIAKFSMCCNTDNYKNAPLEYLKHIGGHISYEEGLLQNVGICMIKQYYILELLTPSFKNLSRSVLLTGMEVMKILKAPISDLWIMSIYKHLDKKYRERLHKYILKKMEIKAASLSVLSYDNRIEISWQSYSRMNAEAIRESLQLNAYLTYPKEILQYKMHSPEIDDRNENCILYPTSAREILEVRKIDVTEILSESKNEQVVKRHNFFPLGIGYSISCQILNTSNSIPHLIIMAHDSITWKKSCKIYINDYEESLNLFNIFLFFHECKSEASYCKIQSVLPNNIKSNGFGRASLAKKRYNDYMLLGTIYGGVASHIIADYTLATYHTIENILSYGLCHVIVSLITNLPLYGIPTVIKFVIQPIKSSKQFILRIDLNTLNQLNEGQQFYQNKLERNDLNNIIKLIVSNIGEKKAESGTQIYLLSSLKLKIIPQSKDITSEFMQSTKISKMQLKPSILHIPYNAQHKIKADIRATEIYCRKEVIYKETIFKGAIKVGLIYGLLLVEYHKFARMLLTRSLYINHLYS